MPDESYVLHFPDGLAVENILKKAQADYTRAQIDELLADKQAKLTSAQQSAVDSGINAAQVEQIETNKNSIIDIKDGTGINSFGDVETALGDKADTSTTYTKTEVDTALSAKANSADVYSKTAVDTALDNKADKSTTYTKTEVDTALSAKADKSTTYTKTEVDTALDDKVDKETGKGLSTNDYTTAEKTKLADIADGAEVNEIEGIKVNGSTVNPDSNKVVSITIPTSAADVSALPDTTKYAVALSLTINSSTYVMTGQLKDQNGDNLGTAQTIDLPLESVVVGGSYDSQTKKVVLTLQNGNTIEFSVADLVSGLQTELSTSNKLNPAFIEYDSTHRAVSDTEKSAWNSKQNALSSTQLDAVNSGIDSAKVEQIETNKNNISSVANVGVKNLCKPNVSADSEITVVVNADLSITVTCNTTALREVHIFTDLSGLTDGKDYILSGCNGGNYSNTYGFAVRTSGGTGKAFESDGETTFTKTAEMVKMDLIIRAGQNWTKTFYPMIRPAYISDPTYQSYAMSNAELTAKEQANENNILLLERSNGTKNCIVINPITRWSLPSGLTVTQNDEGAYVFNGTISSGYKYIAIGEFYYTAQTYYMSRSLLPGAGYCYTNDGNLNSNAGNSYTYLTNGNTRVYIRIGKQSESITFDNAIVRPMIITDSAYNAGFTDYQPYAMSNAELTAKERTNENNISFVQSQANWNTNNGVKNICPYNSGSTSTGEGTVWNNLPIDMAAGTYSLSFSTDSTNSALVLLAADGATEVLRKTYSTTEVNDTFTISTAAKYIRLYIGASKTVSNFMIHSFGDDTFVPYALSNAVITPALKECVDNGAKNLLKLGFSKKIAINQTAEMTADGNGVVINGSRNSVTDTILVYDIVTNLNDGLATRYTLPAGEYIMTKTGDANVRLQAYAHDGTNSIALGYTQVSDLHFEYTNEMKLQYPYLTFRIWVSRVSNFDNFTFYPMICTKTAWDISQAYQPYRPSYQELYEMVKALQANQ